MDLERERALEDAGRKLYAIARLATVSLGSDQREKLREKQEALAAWEQVMLGAPRPDRPI